MSSEEGSSDSPKRVKVEETLLANDVVHLTENQQPLEIEEEEKQQPIVEEEKIVTAPTTTTTTTKQQLGATKKKKAKQPKEQHLQEEVVSSAKGTEKDKEFEVPLAAINKILKAALPEGAVCTKDAKSAFSKAAGIFVLYITACANDMAKTNKRQTINAQDITNALTELGYSSFLPHLEATMEKMKADAAARKSSKDKKKPVDDDPAVVQ